MAESRDISSMDGQSERNDRSSKEQECEKSRHDQNKGSEDGSDDMDGNDKNVGNVASVDETSTFLKKGPKTNNITEKASFGCQLKAMLWRNILLKKRNKKQCLQELFFPVFFVSLMAMIKAMTEPKTFPAASFPENPLSSGMFHFDTSNKLLASPNTSEVDSLMSDVSTLLGGVPYELFPSQAAAEERYKENPTDVAAGIAFGYPGGSIFNYAIRMPYRSLPSISDMFTEARNQGECRNSPNGTDFGRKCQANKYLSTGFVWLQDAVSTALIQKNEPTFPKPEVSVQLMHKDKFTESLDSIQIGSAIYFVLAYSFFISFLVINLVAEKEKKIREAMKMMGLRDSVWWLSWALVYVLIIFVVTLIVVFIAMVTSFFHKESLFVFFLLMFFYGVSIINLAFLMTPFFKKSQVAGIIASFSTIIISLLHFIVSMTRTPTVNGYDYSISPARRWALCLLSPVAFSLAIDQGIFLDVVKGGMTFSTITIGDFPLYAPLTMLLVDSVLYLILAVYFDHILPAEYGPRYKPWYFVTPSYWCGRKRGGLAHKQDEATRLEGTATADGVEPVSVEQARNIGIRLLNISKTFKGQETTIRAVDELSLDIYEGQITALLGHNGAGKTTLINMLCGLSPPSSGTATINGMDVSDSSDLQQIWSMTGVCPQHDILYDDLSVREHLHIFAALKGVKEENTDNVVENIMKAVDIVDQADVFVINMSGGQKRKLSVAIALIGDPKILFLDEPTAGMDPYSRRHLWSLLKKSKEGKIILLTTHFMDEADILADRKAIINHGKLKCCGSSLFLKQKFGIGYHLHMVVEPDCDAAKVADLLKQHVSGVEMKRSHGKELAFTMPMAEVSKFPKLFSALESPVDENQTLSDSLGIKGYGVSMTSLEEVFLKIGSEVEESVPEKPPSPSKHHEITISGENPNITSQRFWALLKIRFLTRFRNPSALIFQMLIPVILVIIGCVVSKEGTPEDVSQTKPVEMKPIYVVPTEAPFLAVDSAGTAISKQFFEELKNAYDIDKVNGSVNIADLPQHWMGLNLHILQKNLTSRYTALYNDTAVHSLPAVLNLVSNALLAFAQNLTGISASSLMWPPVVQFVEPQLTYNSNSFSAAFVLAVAFVVIPAGFAVEMVADRQIKARSQLRVAGITFNMYWCTSFLFHLLINLIPAVVCIVIVFAVQIPSFTTTGAMLVLVLLFVVYIPANLLLAYVFSFAFTTNETCQAVLPNMFLFAGIIPYIAISLMDMLGEPDTAKIVHYVMCTIDPPYAIFGGIYYIDRISVVANILQKPITFDMYFKWSNNIIYPLIMCVLDFIILYLLLQCLDTSVTGGNTNGEFHCLKSKVEQIPEENTDIPDDEDDDVAEERRRVADIQRNQDEVPVTYVENLRKEFKKRGKRSHGFCKKAKDSTKVAVRNVTFAVDKGEVFGLLGPNGAGKTTTLNMIIAETSANRGKIIVAGNSIHSSTSQVLKALGYCPQSDALWPNITLKEHLACYAAIKGIPRGEIYSVVNYYVENLQVEEHQNKWASKLSGGTRRKVSYAISMLNKPQMVLLDEPSTGMDPQSKRFLWDTISSSFKSSDRGAILTTHYMEEADALCSRLAIMVNGQLQCIGATQHLKDRFGSGYLLEVKLHKARGDAEDEMARLESHLATLFPQIDRLERFAERAWYRIAKGEKLLSEAFSVLEDMKGSHSVEEYSFSQSTLEQVFLDFAKKQYDEEINDTEMKDARWISRPCSVSKEEPPAVNV